MQQAEESSSGTFGGKGLADNPGLVASFGSMEGVPEWVDPSESATNSRCRCPVVT